MLETWIARQDKFTNSEMIEMQIDRFIDTLSDKKNASAMRAIRQMGCIEHTTVTLGIHFAAGYIAQDFSITPMQQTIPKTPHT